MDMAPDPRRASSRQRVRLVQVLTAHQVAIVAYARAITADLGQAEDVYQEVGVILAEDPGRIPAVDAEIWPWLREVTRRKALEVRRRSRRGVHLSEQVVAVLDDAFAAPAQDTLADLREAMGRCLEGLDGDARRIVQGRYAEDRECEAIAAQVGRSVQAVYAVLKRARLALQRCVERRLAEAG